MGPITTILALATLALCPSVRTAQVTTNAPVPAKTYRNPLLPDREIADPFVLRVDGK